MPTTGVTPPKTTTDCAQPQIEKADALMSYTRALLHWPVRMAIIVLWLIVGVAGLLLLKPMLANMVTDVSAPSGTAAYESAQVQAEMFPLVAFDITVLVASKNGAPILNVHSKDTPDTALTPVAAGVSGELQEIVMKYSDRCANITYTSFFTVDNASLPSSIPSPLVPAVKTAILGATEKRFFNEDGSAMLALASITKCDSKLVTAACVGKESACDPVAQLQDDLLNYAGETLPGSTAGDQLDAQVTSLSLIQEAAMEATAATMDVSTKTFPLALLVLGCMLVNARLLLLPILSIVCVLGVSVLAVYPLVLSVSVSSTSASLMIAVALAMSLDYALFLLSRLMTELKQGKTMAEAVDISLRFSGRTVLVSGLCLTLCFLTMLVVPVSAISSMGIAASFTVVFAVAISLSLTPALLLSAPSFFGASRLLGCSTDSCCGLTGPHTTCCSKDTDCCQTTSASANKVGSSWFAWWPERGLWATLGATVQRCPWSVLVLLVVIAVVMPFAIELAGFTYSVGMLPLLPSGDDATAAFEAMQASFGSGTIFPSTIIMVPPEGTNMADVNSPWLNASCVALQRIAADIDIPGYAFAATNLSGAMLIGGSCTASKLPSYGLPPSVEASLMDKLAQQYNNAAATATKVSVQIALDPFSKEGKEWIHQMRDAMARHQTVDGVEVGSMYLTGTAPQQWDAADATFAKFPLMIGLVVLAIFVVFGVAFKSVVVPIRAALTVLWMLILIFGAATFLYTSDAIPGGAIYWMTPCIAFSVAVGLGLDYDVFLMESVMEHVLDGGLTVNAAVIAALEQTGGSIAAAGVVMVIAFAALMLSASPVLYELGFLLIFGVILDCFVTTKVIIPCFMAIIPERLNFWPLRVPETPAQQAMPKPQPIKADVVVKVEDSKADTPPLSPSSSDVVDVV
mmetsp:Transcript_1548/g.4369  ORF Transcript_1548/g.4369 Transcript_1548/m.4369 type:complete len:913 (+) Transcript_1548:296-3034(+)|eukprot:CAMPEP_0115848814 /NCGR_PEP_ID=MMETSP0287-20121206/11123_1 /TAXON_ID=412157 /ORGANISM="Chrysochromulina rotalis, Strain UIO044" /LENGTH=912 /DNA_ID=CAMNT_0003302753 /DNA_START=257 /DNA_END=2995 /DNA_ORIENTATION=+